MAQFASDAFTTGTSQTLEAYSASWSRVGSDGQMSVTADYDRVFYGTSAGSRYIYNATPASADYSVSVDVYVASTLATSAAGPMIRASATGPNFYMARTVQGIGYQLFKCVSGSYTQLGSTSSATFTAGSTYNLKIEAIGTAIKLYINGSGTATISATDSAISAANKPGIYKYEASAGSDSTGHHIDNFSADQTSAEITGSLSATEAQDSAAIVGNVLITGTLSATESQDSASFTGSVISTITGALAATETQDSASFAGNIYITGTLAATEPQDSAVFSGPVAVSEQTPNRAGGSYTSRKRQKIVLLERVEDVEDFVEQVEQVVKEAPKAKPVLRKVKKLRPQTVENTYDNAQAWVDYYQRMAEALQDREQAAQLQADLERGAKMLESVLALRETQELLRISKRREDEELLLMLMAA